MKVGATHVLETYLSSKKSASLKCCYVESCNYISDKNKIIVIYCSVYFFPFTNLRLYLK